jgi:integrase
MVEKHGKKWRYDFLKDGIRYKKGGYRTKGDAIEAEARARATAKTINMDFLRLCNARLEDLEVRRTNDYFLENKRLFENLMEMWGDFPTITKDDVETYLKQVAKDSKPVANKHLRLIKALFNHGVKRQWFQFNPAVGIELFGVPRKKKYIPPMADIEKVLSLATPEQREYLIVVSHTLARVREINRLKWDDVNLDEGYIILRTRKSKNSDIVERKVPMTSTVREILSLLPKVGDYVFMNPRTNKRYQYRRKFLHTLCAKAEVKSFMYHALRHYGASKLMNAGAPLTDIQEILGHQRPTTTDIYLQSLKGSLQETIKKLEE